MLPHIRFTLLLSRLLLVVLAGCSVAGCFNPWFRRPTEGPEAIQTRREAIRQKLEADDRPRMLREIASERLVTLSRLENVGMVNGLANTGGSVKASQQREKMLAVMRREEVAEPNTLLDAPTTALVVAYTNVPPAARKGQVLDVSVKLSAHAEGTDLRRGWLMSTSLMEMGKLGGTVREGFEYAIVQGPVVTREQILGSDLPEDRIEGLVIGGARLLRQRELGLGVVPDFADAITMAAIVPVINARFTIFDGSKKVGVATPEKDSFITLAVPAKYQRDPHHFVNVVLSLGFNEGSDHRASRLRLLEQQSQEPKTARQACWELEAIGEASIPTLVGNLKHPSAEVRFYNAHSLAYLNDKRAINPLMALCRQEPAFRAMCLNALAIIDSYEAADALESLLHAADAETRYGAVRALRQRDRMDARVTGQMAEQVGMILEVPSEGLPMVAVSLQDLAEVVIFGSNPELTLPAFHYINPEIIIQRSESGAKISRFVAGKDDAIVYTGRDLRSVLTGIAEVGGTYGDWISFLRVSSQQGYMMEPLAMNPVPQAGRTFNREKDTLIDGLALDDGKPAPRTDRMSSKSSTSGAQSAFVWYNPISWFRSE
jgi:hypothetical protein